MKRAPGHGRRVLRRPAPQGLKAYAVESSSMLMLSPLDCKPKVRQVRRRSWFHPPWVFWWARSGLLSQSQFSTCFEATGVHFNMAGTRWRPSVPGMPKRVNASISRIPVAGVDPFGPSSLAAADYSLRAFNLPWQSCLAAHPRLPLIGCPMQRGPRTPSSATRIGPMLRCSILHAAVPKQRLPRPSATPTLRSWCRNSSSTGTPRLVRPVRLAC